MSSKVLIEKIRLIEGLIEKGPNCINCEIWGKIEINILHKSSFGQQQQCNFEKSPKIVEIELEDE